MNIKVVAQVFSMSALLLGMSSHWRKKRENILLQQALGGMLMAIQFLMLGSLTACLTSLISCIRGAVFSKKNKVTWINNPITLIVFTIVYVIIGISTWDGYMTIVPILGSAYYMFASWNNNTNTVRSGTIVASTSWAIYDIYCMAYVACIAEIISITSASLAIIRNKRSKSIRMGKDSTVKDI